eukprot:g12148.t1
MIDLVDKKCAHPGCTKRPSFGLAGTNKREFCTEHGKEGMIHLISKKCAHQGCIAQPLYGVAGSKKREFCSKRAKQGMVDLHRKKCAQLDCSKYPSFGLVGTKKRVVCREHAEDGMVHYRSTENVVRGNKRGRGASVVPPAHPGESSIATSNDGSGGSGGGITAPHPPANQIRTDRAPPSTGPATSEGGTIHRDRAGRVCHRNRISRVDRLPSPASLASHPDLSADEDDDIGTATAVKPEGVEIASSLLSSEDTTGTGDSAARRTGDGRNKRKGRDPPSATTRNSLDLPVQERTAAVGGVESGIVKPSTMMRLLSWSRTAEQYVRGRPPPRKQEQEWR